MFEFTGYCPELINKIYFKFFPGHPDFLVFTRMKY